MDDYTRRIALKKIGLSAISAFCLSEQLLLPVSGNADETRHLITFGFDDGFKKSCIEAARIFEKYHLSASFNIIASADVPGFELPDEYHRWPVGDFNLWNELQSRGHEIMMHGYKHANKAEMPFSEAKEMILRCINVFSKKLKGFDPKKSVFNFPYNASTLALESWLPTQVRAFRTNGPIINPVPFPGQVKLTSSGFGPEMIDQAIEAEIEKLLAGPSGWSVFTLHGLDDEGWGPVSSDFLDKTLKRLSLEKTVSIGPVSKFLL